MLHQKFAQRFQELTANFAQLRYSASPDEGRHVDGGVWQQWATSVQSLIRAVFGEASPHYQNFLAEYGRCSGYDFQLSTLNAIFKSARDDFEGGYVFNVELRVSGEVFGDFVTLAKQALAEGHKDVAAVLACAALEDALKRFAAVNSVAVTDKSMQEVVNALKGAGLVMGAQKTLLDAMPRIRNIAMHADWSKLSEPDVNSVIGFVEQFLLSRFSGN